MASSMSLTYAPPSAYGSRAGSESPIPHHHHHGDFHNDFTSITNQLQALERCPDVREEEEEEVLEALKTPVKKKSSTSGKKR